MGRKSRLKKHRFEAGSALKKNQNQQKIIAYLILFSGVGLFICGLLLFDKTFISYQAETIITLLGAAAGITAFHFIWRQKKYGLWVTLFYGFFLGGPIPYFLIATTNYYLRDNKSTLIQLNIIETGNESSRKSSCRVPYAVVEYEGIKKKIHFACKYENTISNYRSIKLTVSDGFWGYRVYIDKKLNE